MINRNYLSPKVIAVEGNVFVGKTTLCNELSAHTGYRVFPDHAFVEPPKPIITLKDAMDNQLTYLNLEVQRKIAAKSLSGCILDRSVISICAYTYYLSKNGFQISEEFLAELEKLIMADKILLPGYLVYIRTTTKEISLRYHNNKDTQKVTELGYINKNFMHLIESFNLELIRRIGGLILDNCTISESLTKTLDYIETKNEIDKNLFLGAIKSIWATK